MAIQAIIFTLKAPTDFLQQNIYPGLLRREEKRAYLIQGKSLAALLGVSVDSGYDSRSGWGGGLFLGLLPQILADVWGGIGALQFGLLLFSLVAGVRLSWLWRLLFDCGWSGRWRLRHRDLRGVQVDPISWGMVVSVCPGHCVKELTKKEKQRKV